MRDLFAEITRAIPLEKASLMSEDSGKAQSLQFLWNARICTPLSFHKNLMFLTIVQDCGISEPSECVVQLS